MQKAFLLVSWVRNPSVQMFEIRSNQRYAWNETYLKRNAHAKQMHDNHDYPLPPTPTACVLLWHPHLDPPGYNPCPNSSPMPHPWIPGCALGGRIREFIQRSVMGTIRSYSHPTHTRSGWPLTQKVWPLNLGLTSGDHDLPTMPPYNASNDCQVTHAGNNNTSNTGLHAVNMQQEIARNTLLLWCYLLRLHCTASSFTFSY